VQGVGSQVCLLTYIASVGVESGFGRVPLIGAAGVVVRVRSLQVWGFRFGVHSVKGSRLQILCRNLQWFPSGLVFKAPRLLFHSTLVSRAIKKNGGVPLDEARQPVLAVVQTV
jgi:hypothetical protein